MQLGDGDQPGIITLELFDNNQGAACFSPAMQQVVTAALRVPAAAAQAKKADRIIDAHDRVKAVLAR